MKDSVVSFLLFRLVVFVFEEEVEAEDTSFTTSTFLLVCIVNGLVLERAEG